MIIQPINGRDQAIKLATCAGRLRNPLSEYDQQSVSELIEREASPTLSIRALHKPINAFQSLKPDMMNINEWKFINSLKTVTIDDHASRPVIYALIPPSVVAEMSDVDFHSLLESLANNERIKDHIRKTCGYDCGLVFFMIDDMDSGKSTRSTEPMGIDFHRFTAEPNKDKLVMLGATGANPITPDDIQEFAKSNVGNETCVKATDLRRIVPQGVDEAKYLLTESLPLLACFGEQRELLREKLNGRGRIDEADDPKTELRGLINNGDVESPQTGDPLSDILLDRTAPSVVEAARFYRYHPKSQSFVDRREPLDEFDSASDLKNQLDREQLLLRSPYPVRGQRADERRTLA